LDGLINRLISKAGKGTNVILMSDHGFGPVHKFFHVNSFLHKLGLLEFKSGNSGEYLNIKGRRSSRSLLQKMLLKLGITKETIYNNAKKIHMIKILQLIYKKAKVPLPTTKRSIDWKRTKAFFNSSVGSSASISINLENREPEGIVKKEEYERLKAFIISELLKLKDPETGQKIVQDAFKRENIYHGPYISEAPDIIFITKDFKYVATDRIYGSSLVSEPIYKGRGTHKLNGILIAHGPDFKNTGENVGKARIIDLAPTILHMFELMVPEDMDGKVLTYIFRHDSIIAKKAIKYRKTTERERTKEKIMQMKNFKRKRT